MVTMTEVPATEVTIVRVAVRCTGTRKDGSLCNNLLAKVDADRWEEAMTDAVLSYCERCGREYSLQEYR